MGTAENALAVAALALRGEGFDPVPIPAGLGWDQSAFPLAIGLRDAGGAYADGQVSLDPKAGARYLACLAGTVRYADISKSDANDGLTPATAVRTLWKAQQLLNAAGQPGVIKAAAGTYNKDANFTIGNAANLAAVDTVYMATGGRVLVTAHAQVTFALDATFTNTYSAARSLVGRVVDLKAKGPAGLYREFVKVADAATCNARAWTWAQVASTLYVNRGDGLAVADANTRVYLQVPNFLSTGATPRNLYVVGETASDGWDFEGGTNSGGGGGCLTVSYTAAGAQPVTLYAERSTFRYSGVYGDTTLGQGVTVNSVHGLTMFSACDFSGAKSDGLNSHDANAVGGCFLLSVNCTADGCGLQTATSCNSWTTHEGVIGIDVAGIYRGGAGCTVHAINTTKSFMVGTAAEASRGDQIHGGGFYPSEFRVSDEAEMWVYRGRPRPATAGGFAYQASESGQIHRRDCWPTAGLVSTSGTAVVDDY